MTRCRVSTQSPAANTWAAERALVIVGRDPASGPDRDPGRSGPASRSGAHRCRARSGPPGSVPLSVSAAIARPPSTLKPCTELTEVEVDAEPTQRVGDLIPHVRVQRGQRSRIGAEHRDLEAPPEQGLGDLDTDVPGAHDDGALRRLFVDDPPQDDAVVERLDAVDPRGVDAGQVRARSASPRSRSRAGHSARSISASAPDGGVRDRGPSRCAASVSIAITSWRMRTSIPSRRCVLRRPRHEIVGVMDEVTDEVRDPARGERRVLTASRTRRSRARRTVRRRRAPAAALIPAASPPTTSSRSVTTAPRPTGRRVCREGRLGTLTAETEGEAGRGGGGVAAARISTSRTSVRRIFTVVTLTSRRGYWCSDRRRDHGQ